MSQRRISLTLLVSLIIGLGIGFYLGHRYSQPTPVDYKIPGEEIKTNNEKIDSFSTVAKLSEKKVDSLKQALKNVRESKDKVIKEALKKEVAITELNKQLEEFERKYSKYDSSLIFVDSSLIAKQDGTIVVSKSGLSRITGIIEENKQKDLEIHDLDSIVAVDSVIISAKDTIITNILDREAKKDVYFKAQYEALSKKSKKKSVRSFLIGLVAGILGGILVVK